MQPQSSIQQTFCGSRTHKVLYFLGGTTHEFKYRACKNRKFRSHVSALQLFYFNLAGANGMQCVDGSANLPPLCPSNGQPGDCSEIVWHVNGQTTVFDICDGMIKITFSCYCTNLVAILCN